MSLEVIQSVGGQGQRRLTYFKGDVVSVEIPGLSMVILNTHDAAQELLAKRPNTTSGRKVGYMALKM